MPQLSCVCATSACRSHGSDEGVDGPAAHVEGPDQLGALWASEQDIAG